LTDGIQENEDADFWERELGGSHQRRRASATENEEDGAFWERELGGSHRRRCVIVV